MQKVLMCHTHINNYFKEKKSNGICIAKQAVKIRGTGESFHFVEDVRNHLQRSKFSRVC